jgi:hypothetical protein
MKADMTYREVPQPFNRWCASGHCAPETFPRNGPELPAEPTKFFSVSGNGDIEGTYCELCLIVAQHIAQEKKKGNII